MRVSPPRSPVIASVGMPRVEAHDADLLLFSLILVSRRSGGWFAWPRSAVDFAPPASRDVMLRADRRRCRLQLRACFSSPSSAAESIACSSSSGQADSCCSEGRSSPLEEGVQPRATMQQATSGGTRRQANRGRSNEESTVASVAAQRSHDVASLLQSLLGFLVNLWTCAYCDLENC